MTEQPNNVTKQMMEELGNKVYEYIIEKHHFDEDMTGRIVGVMLESLGYADLKNQFENNKEKLDAIIKEVKATLSMIDDD